MMQLILISFVMMLLVVGMMAIGYIVQRKKIKGSCGGIADLGLEKVCDCEEPCDKRKELMARMEAEREAERLIDIKLIDQK